MPHSARNPLSAQNGRAPDAGPRLLPSYRRLATDPNALSSKAALFALEYLVDRNATRAARLQLDADDVLVRLSAIARADLRDAFDDEGTLLPVHRWPDT